MGKAQSKRSVDITTENKDGVAVDTEAGKVGKIEDIEKPQLNGDVKDAEASVSMQLCMHAENSWNSHEDSHFHCPSSFE